MVLVGGNGAEGSRIGGRTRLERKNLLAKACDKEQRGRPAQPVSHRNGDVSSGGEGGAVLMHELVMMRGAHSVAEGR